MWRVLVGCLAWTLVLSWNPDIKLDAESIIYLDNAMYEDVTTPKGIKKNVIMQNMLKLYLTLDQIYEKLQDSEDTENLTAIVQKIKDGGGLKIVNLKQDNEKVMNTYDWDEDRATQLRRNLERASDKWRNLVELVDDINKAAM